MTRAEESMCRLLIHNSSTNRHHLQGLNKIKVLQQQPNPISRNAWQFTLDLLIKLYKIRDINRVNGTSQRIGHKCQRLKNQPVHHLLDLMRSKAVLEHSVVAEAVEEAKTLKDGLRSGILIYNLRPKVNKTLSRK